jgi:hypothetical protein
MEHGEPIPLTGAEESVEEAIERIVSETNIFIAAGDGHLDEVQSFVAAGVPGGVNAQDEWGYSPLCVFYRRGSAAHACGRGGGRGS